MEELRNLRRMKGEWESQKTIERKQGPGDEQWRRLREESERLRRLEIESETAFNRREAKMKASEAELKAKLKEAGEREAAAEAKAAEAMRALEAANEATATAEHAASEIEKNRVRDEPLCTIRAVARDRGLQRRRRAKGGARWWEMSGGGVSVRSGVSSGPQSGVCSGAGVGAGSGLVGPCAMPTAVFFAPRWIVVPTGREAYDLGGTGGEASKTAT